MCIIIIILLLSSNLLQNLILLGWIMNCKYYLHPISKIKIKLDLIIKTKFWIGGKNSKNYEMMALGGDASICACGFDTCPSLVLSCLFLSLLLPPLSFFVYFSFFLCSQSCHFQLFSQNTNNPR